MEMRGELLRYEPGVEAGVEDFAGALAFVSPEPGLASFAALAESDFESDLVSDFESDLGSDLESDFDSESLPDELLLGA
jgi:hypothetical protein